MTRWAQILIITNTLALAGCTFSAPQLEALGGMFEAPSDPTADYQWQVTINDTTYNLVAIDDGNEILFSQADAGLVGFDGWSLTRVSGFGLLSPFTIKSSPGQRTYKQRSATRIHSCSPWQQQELTWTQACRSPAVYTNTIQLNSSGQIIRIDQVYDATNRLILEKR